MITSPRVSVEELIAALEKNYPDVAFERRRRRWYHVWPFRTFETHCGMPQEIFNTFYRASRAPVREVALGCRYCGAVQIHASAFDARAGDIF